ncbi:MAG TPA: (E)-4-hydroxy-3-methylbut-2-enyl-diphosphate synthase [Chloroflexota bacterium]|nr:(E)-4-hydroxy-3-methylbut-2-enyl-diphosphate synthase [Chloroflexota bacterium]
MTLDARSPVSLNELPYCPSAFSYRRRSTHVVMIGGVGVGGTNPIRVQSMTTTRTQDVDATAAQAERLVRVGCEIVRITAPTVQDAKAIGEIRKQLHARGIKVPLVADIHFSPAAAMEAANHVEKVRINPGNFADSRQFAVREYTDLEYEQELERIEARFTPLVLKCKSLGIAIRVGTNHGSLSDRIMNRFGDTPLGMVESALEFLRICQKNDYPDVILSMKASNPKVMIQAYRLLVARMDEVGMTFPLHLGVTEAGNDEDGRIKSAVGIGALLDDGLGDTIRVSLTEEPEAEIPVAVRLAAPYQDAAERQFIDRGAEPDPRETRNPYAFTRRLSTEASAGAWSVGGRETVRALQAISTTNGTAPASLVERAVALATAARPGAPAPDAVELPGDTAEQRAELRNLAVRLATEAPSVSVAVRLTPAAERAGEALAAASVVHWISPGAAPSPGLLGAVAAVDCALILETSIDGHCVDASVDRLLAWAHRSIAVGVQSPALAISSQDASIAIRAYRLLAARLHEAGLACPLHLIAPETDSPYERLLRTSVALGGLLCDGIGDSVEVRGSDERPSTRLAFNVLQASGARISKTEYVACPSCGRTLFDLQPVTDRIKSVTGHLTGVKIAIMGCIVNGPGEMADADFGYVGGAPGKVNLYVGKECVEKNVPQAEADDRLIELLKAHGAWTEPADAS